MDGGGGGDAGDDGDDDDGCKILDQVAVRNSKVAELYRSSTTRSELMLVNNFNGSTAERSRSEARRGAEVL